MTLSIIQGFLDLFNDQNTETKAFIVHVLIGLEEGHLQNLVKEVTGKQLKYLTFIINVGGNIAETFLCTPNKQGCHWTLLHIDTSEKKWSYCDSLGWAPPNDLKDLKDVNNVLHRFMLPIRTVKGRFLAHKPNFTSQLKQQYSSADM